jgi:AraC-like DNA-binding protein
MVTVTELGADHPLLPSGMHFGQSYLMIYLKDGRGSLRTVTGVREIAAGDIVAIAPGELFDAEGLTDAQGWVVAFRAAALGQHYSDVELVFPSALPEHLRSVGLFRFGSSDLPTVGVPVQSRGEWEARLSRMSVEVRERSTGYAGVVSAELCVMLIGYSRLISHEGGVSDAGTACPLIQSVFRYIDAHYRRPIALADVAKAVGKSRAYLTQLVRRETSLTVGDWITERRMAEARRLLHTTDSDIAGVARALSFSDPGYFIRLFRRHHGATPAAWRNAQRRPSEANGTAPGDVSPDVTAIHQPIRRTDKPIAVRHRA